MSYFLDCAVAGMIFGLLIAFDVAAQAIARRVKEFEIIQMREEASSNATKFTEV